MYLACLKKSYWCIAVLGALAVVIRQTNDNVTSNSNLRRRKLSDALGTDKQSMPSARFFQQITHQRCVAGLLDEVEVILLALWHRKWELLVFFSPFVMVFVAFLALSIGMEV
ncbi:hypothetical protein ACJW31_07G066500 [Castanea mollissima]